MNYTQKAIELAVEGGYDVLGLFKNYGVGEPKIEYGIPMPPYRFQIDVWTIQVPIDSAERIKYEVQIEQVWNDPLFWQALGKSLGWNTEMYSKYYRNRVGGVDESLDLEYEEVLDPASYQMHLFIEHLIANKPIEEFFEQLINKSVW